MIIILNHLSVDSSPHDNDTEFRNIKECLQFLKERDHEGSSLGLLIQSDDNEEVYKILDKLKEE